MQSVVQSIYSAVVKDVVNSIAEDHSGLESSVISEIQNRWMEEYTALAGSTLNLSFEEKERSGQPDEAEQAKVCYISKYLKGRKRRKPKVTLHSPPVSLAILWL